MFGSELLEVAIGVVFIYLLLSLLTVALTEMISRVFAIRASTLVDAVRNLIQDPDRFYAHPLIKAISPAKPGHSIGQGRGKPSYIDPKTFAIAALDTLFPRVDEQGNIIEEPEYLQMVKAQIATLPEEFKRPLQLALADAQNGIAAIREQYELSFNNLMERVSGWYKRKAQLVSLAVGLVVAVAANADSLAITNALLRDATLRDAIVASAEQTAAGDESDLPGEINVIQDQLLETQILGWISSSTSSSNDASGDNPDPRAIPTTFGGWLLRVFGWLITAYAVSLGAPFWFDVLNKITSIRSSGKPPQEEDSEGSTLLEIKART